MCLGNHIDVHSSIVSFRYIPVRIRNGVETIPSILRRKYQIDHMPVRGLLSTKLRFGIKLAALNFKKLSAYLNGLDRCADLFWAVLRMALTPFQCPLLLKPIFSFSMSCYRYDYLTINQQFY